MLSHARSTPLLPLALAIPFCLLAACSNGSDDNNNGGGSVAAQTFAAALDETQVSPAPASGTRVRVTVTNRAPDNGTFQTPVWVGFHDGTFEILDIGSPAATHFPITNALERLAEDGETGPLQTAFGLQASGSVQGVLKGQLGPMSGPIAPGETVSAVFELDPTAPTSRWLSFASMIIPSNDAFVANDAPMAHAVFDAGGNFVATDFVVSGGSALDAGTEVNDEVPANTAFFGQTVGDTGVAQGGNVAPHPGFMPAGSGGILDDPMFADADFTAGGYELLAFRFEELPASAPATGIASLILSGDGSTVTVSISAFGLSGPATSVQLRMAAAGSNGPTVLDLTSLVETNADGTVTVEGSLPAPAGLAEDLRAGNVYVVIATALNPQGELRGQIDTSEVFSGAVSSAQEVPTPVVGTGVRVTVRNEAPEGGTFQTPVWVGFHVGTFEIFDLGVPAVFHFPLTDGLEHLAEDGDPSGIQETFEMKMVGSVQGVLKGQLGPMSGPIAPGETVSKVFQLDATAASSQFMSYASMIIPSNDAFVANDNRFDVRIFDGGFVATDFTVPGSAALDAGTEVNDELPANTAFFGQTTPDTGVDQGGVVTQHPGFLAPGSGGILDDPMFQNAVFTAPGYELLSFRFAQEPAAGPAMGQVVAHLDATRSNIVFSVQVQGLSGPATMMHFHQGAPGTAGPVLIGITDTISVNEDGVLVASGTKPVDAQFVQLLRQGNVYVNVHTALNPAGEARGQVRLAQ